MSCNQFMHASTHGFIGLPTISQNLQDVNSRSALVQPALQVQLRAFCWRPCTHAISAVPG